jgi:hypothetical protein
MKKTFTNLMLCTFIYLFPGWNGTFAQAPFNFQGSFAYNPVLQAGDINSWERATFLPYAFIHDNIFYIFYSGINTNMVTSIGMATSADGYTFTKHEGNPVFTPSLNGFDSYNVTQGIVIEGQTGWIMYYNGRKLTGYGPGPYIGRATAPDPTGPWTRSVSPVLSKGSSGEWDSDFISPTNVFAMDTGGFIMFYYAGYDFSSSVGHQIGMATSPDGLVWTKYDDPLTTEHPYAESDPVLKVGNPTEWDGIQVWLCNVLKNQDGFEMYYTGQSYAGIFAFGYASSPDGIIWIKDTGNPVYTINDDEYAVMMGYSIIEQPAILISGSKAFMYYDYGILYPGEIGVATADIPTRINDEKIWNDELRFTICPNPITYSTTFSYMLKEPGNVTINIFNSQCQLVAQPLNAYQARGEQKVTWNTGNLPSGIYFYRLQSGNEAGGGKMVVVK